MNKRKILLFLLVPLLIVIDQLTKYFAEVSLLEGHSVSIIDNFFYFTLIYNTGAAWSSFSNSRWLLVGISTITAIGFSIYYFKYQKKRSVFGNISIILIVGGALGNWIDRVFYGRVVDFLDFYIFGYNFPVFNFADICVVCGTIALILFMYIDEKKVKNG